MNQHWILLRGLSRGNGHWGSFPEVLKKQGLKWELAEIPGNGTRYQEITPLRPQEVIQSLRKNSHFLKDKKKINICAISLGGMLALKWAEAFPDEIERVVIINSSLSQLSPIYHRMSFKALFKVLQGLISHDPIFREKTTLDLTVSRKRVRDQYLQVFANFSKEHPVSASNFLRQIYLATQIHVDQKIKVPVSVIVSEKDRFVNPDCSFKMAEFFKVKPIINSNAGHDLPLESPQWLASILIKSDFQKYERLL